MPNVLVIGDIILDVNLFSVINRNAPEKETLPIHDVFTQKYVLGGSANVAKNLANLGTKVSLVGVIGNDHYGDILFQEIQNHNIRNKIFRSNDRQTTAKTRIYTTSAANSTKELQVRFDTETREDIGYNVVNDILRYIAAEHNVNKIDAIVLSDYDKGTLTTELCQGIIRFSVKNGIPTFVDPKIKNYMKYVGCFLFKPNQHESEMLTHQTSLPNIMDTLKTMIQCDHILLTRGKEGMILDSLSQRIEHNDIIHVVDVTGAGDIVMAVLVYWYITYGDLITSAKLANYVAGKSVGVVGNYSTSVSDISEYFTQTYIGTIENSRPPLEDDKIIYDTDSSRLLEFRHMNKKIVFTNGCFDILHSAHIKLLQHAKKLGDILIVGINSDNSVSRLKGPSRPINTIDERATILSCFDFVDYIVIFDADTPYEILSNIRPNVLVKGGDYRVENIVGGEFAEEIILFDFIDGKSSSRVINKIKNQIQDL